MAINGFEFEDNGPLSEVKCEEVPDLMIIAGPNGVGKTTLLNSIADQYGSRFSSIDERPAEDVIQDVNQIVRKFRINRPEAGEFIESPEVKTHEGDETDVAFVGPHRGLSGNMEIEKRNLLGMPSYSSKLLYALSNASQNTVNNYLRRGEGNIPSGPYRQREKGESDELPYYEVRRRLSQIQHDINQYHQEKSKKGEDIDDAVKTWLTPIKQAIDEVLPGIELLKIDETDDHRFVLRFENRDGSIVRFNELSSGEKDAIALLFLLVEDEIEQQFDHLDIVDKSEEDLVVLYDSPEAYLHPQLQLTFINYIKSYLKTKSKSDRSIQIIICTHSKMMIDNVGDESLFYLYFPDQVEENQLRPASEVPDELQTLISKEIGLTALSSGEDMLLVEGQDDREVFNRIDEDLNHHLSIIPMGGKERIIELDDAFNKLVPKLKDNGINLYAIVDRDRDLDLNRRISDNIHTLPSNSVENIVLKPEAIFETLKQILGRELSKSKYDKPEDIEYLLQDIISNDEFILSESQMRWNEQFNPFNLSYSSYEASEGFGSIEDFAQNELTAKLDDVKDFSQIKEEVEELVENGDIDKLHGKRILNKLSTKFGIDSGVLLRMCASELEYQDLPEETIDFLDEVRPN